MSPRDCWKLSLTHFNLHKGKPAYGPGAPYLHRGMAGHFRGKVGFRRQTKLRVRIHDLIWPVEPGREPPQAVELVDLPPFTTPDDVQLLHFDGWSPLRWAAKLIRFAELGRFNRHHRGRNRSIQYIADHASLADWLSLFGQVQRLTTEGLERLSEAGLLRHAAFDPTDLTRAILPDVEMNFSITAYEQRLRENSRDFYLRNGL